MRIDWSQIGESGTWKGKGTDKWRTRFAFSKIIDREVLVVVVTEYKDGWYLSFSTSSREENEDVGPYESMGVADEMAYLKLSVEGWL